MFGLAASGNTQFTNEILKFSSSKNALTIAISNNPNGFILNNARCKIILNTKEEVVAGSTRLKAGTAQKVCLNIISTLVMTQLGGVKKGMMVNMIPKNEKLRQRAKLIKKKNYQKIMSKIQPIILAGGSGTRLWPLSRQNFPKQFSKIIGTNSLFQETLLRF